MAVDPVVEEMVDIAMPEYKLEKKVKDLNESPDIPGQEEFSVGARDVKGTPVFEVLSIRLKPKTVSTNDALTSWQISGSIQTDDELDDRWVIYDSPPHRPDKISKMDSHGNLCLTLPDCGPIWSFFPALNVKVNLMDSVQKLVLVDNSFTIDYKDYVDYDKVQCKSVEGDRATLFVKYITYRAAVIATVDVILMKKKDQVLEEDDSDGKVAGFVEVKREDSVDISGMVSVSGTIYASCLYNSSDYSAHDHFKTDCTCIPLFEFPNETVDMTLGTSMKLSRSLVAVPAYSLLVIETHLNVPGFGVVKDIVEFPANCYLGTYEKNVEGPDGLICQVKVKWGHEYLVHMDMDMEEAPSSESELSKMGQQKKIKVIGDQQASSSSYLYNLPIALEFVGEKLMEVFSIFIGLNKDEVYDIYGTIEVINGMSEFKIFDKDESCAEKFTSSKFLCLQGPYNTCFVCMDELVMKVDLKLIGGHQFCKGFFAWNIIGSSQRLWLDKHLCSVIKGQLGYAAVHYSIFSSAIQAKVKVFLSLISSVNFINISGSLVAEYGEHDYTTYYDREYYRSVLFSRTPESSAQLLRDHEVPTPNSSEISSSDKITGIPLPLSKFLVCVPNDSSLVVEVNLSAYPEAKGSTSEDLHFSGKADFQIGREMCWVTENHSYKIYMLVEWSNIMYHP